MNKVLILGGYGNFGERISIALAKENIAIVIAGRNKTKAEALKQKIKHLYPNAPVTTAIFDIKDSFAEELNKILPAVVINTCGPFQNSDYSIAETCIDLKVHYIDLADGRDFVTGVSALNQKAQKNNVLIVSGASTVPGLSSSVLEHYKNNFSEIDSLRYGISPGQISPRGLATAESILTYLGKPLKPVPGQNKIIYGWQDLYRQAYPELGYRWMANCDIPDLDIFPQTYHIRSIRFSAGMESTLLHLSMWLSSWLVRLGAPINLSKHAPKLLQLSNLFNIFGTTSGGMHMTIKGKDKDNKFKEINWFLIAKNNDGPQIPCVPAILLSKKILSGELKKTGAYPCVGFITLDEYMNELSGLSIKQFSEQK